MPRRYVSPGSYSGTGLGLSGWLAVLAVAGIAVVLLFFIITPFISAWFTKTEVTFTVHDSVVKSSGDSGQKYIYFATKANGENETFENTDAWLNGKTNSSDLHFALKKEFGSEITCTVRGWRVSLLSWYRNILECEGVRT